MQILKVKKSFAVFLNKKLWVIKRGMRVGIKLV